MIVHEWESLSCKKCVYLQCVPYECAYACYVDRYTLFPLIPTLALLRNIHVHVHVATFKELNYLIYTLCGMPCLSVPLQVPIIDNWLHTQHVHVRVINFIMCVCMDVLFRYFGKFRVYGTIVFTFKKINKNWFTYWSRILTSTCGYYHHTLHSSQWDSVSNHDYNKYVIYWDNRIQLKVIETGRILAMCYYHTCIHRVQVHDIICYSSSMYHIIAGSLLLGELRHQPNDGEFFTSLIRVVWPA